MRVRTSGGLVAQKEDQMNVLAWGTKRLDGKKRGGKLVEAIKRVAR